MPRPIQKSWLAHKLNTALTAGFSRAYATVRVDPAVYLRSIQKRYGLPIERFEDMFWISENEVERLADDAVAAARRLALLEGTGLGLGGLSTIIPDMGILAAILLRMLQKLSLIYGFELRTEEDEAMLWVAAASAAGLDLSREFLEKQAIERLAPRLIELVAARLSAELAEKWATRIVPILSGALGGTLNYWFIRQWAKRARRHFRERRRQVRLALVAQPSPLRHVSLSSGKGLRN
jgi:hypothetical protein